LLLRDLKHGEKIAGMEPKVNRNDDEDWLRKTPDELTAKLNDLKVEEVLDTLDSRFNSGMDRAPNPF
jgi:hypothetical protein